MIGSISSAVQSQPVAQPVAPKSVQPASRPAASVPTDTVKISSAASAILQESMESAAQTAKEAGGGDMQAQRLLARQAAAHK